MGLKRSRILLVLLVSCFCLQVCSCQTDRITSSQFIKDPESIVSNGNIYKLGFFSPEESSDRYVGIWYTNISEQTVIWVANRNNPVKNSSGILTISEDGNLVVLSEENRIIWSSNVSISATNTSAQLLDSGNLVLQNNSDGNRIWESFHQPSDSFLLQMTLSTDARIGKNLQLVSWKSPSDPSTGNFSFGIGQVSIPELFIWNNGHPFYRTGPWNGHIFLGIPGMNSNLFHNVFSLLSDREAETAQITFTPATASGVFYFSLNSEGKMLRKVLDEEKGDWNITSSLPLDQCDFYGKCGNFGACNSRGQPICSCLDGFEPKNKREWNDRNWTSGCTRRTPLMCERIINGGAGDEPDGFFRLQTMKVPDFAEWSSAPESQCRDQCLINCSCLAYAFDSGIGCMTWGGNLIDTQKLAGNGLDLYVRVAHSELDQKDNKKIIIITTAIIGTILIAVCVIFARWRLLKHKDSKSAPKEMKKGNSFLKRREAQFSDDSLLGEINQVDFQELPLFEFEILVTATNSFQPSNKLGQGGFGLVYKGKLQDGQEIAVKRLSQTSGQGMEEFMNEVVVISKLQHRNLVKLLGCCIEGDEKMLVYEYMPNKSLDAFIFDPLKQGLLDWSKRFNIIQGISRGVLYLHRDSRLRIIHRDLKASNILLDAEMDPKISDFGMARIFGGNENQASTRRVVGTYGYMSPEYAMEGRFSEKSDVFSFGVLLLEIVSGRKNTSFHDDIHSLSLLGYAWKLWKEEIVSPLIDSTISDPIFRNEILRCIHIGLLCVQEFVQDRPSMSAVISMLNSEILDLPAPKQPGFTGRQFTTDTESSQQNQEITCSVNKVTITCVEGR